MHCSKVTLVEDDADIRETFSEILTSEGYDVQSYSNGAEALKGLKEAAESCLILLDLMMPVMNGHEFLNARKTVNNKLLDIPVIIISAYADTMKNTEGVVGYMKKPVDVDSLLSLVAQHCSPMIA